MSIEYLNMDGKLKYVDINNLVDGQKKILVSKLPNINHREGFTVEDVSGVINSITGYNFSVNSVSHEKYNLGETYSQKGLPNYTPTIVDQKEIDTNESLRAYNYLFTTSVLTTLAIGTLIGILLAKQ